MARTKNSKVTEKVNTEKIEEKVNIEALSNVDTIETELKEEYKEEMSATEKEMSDKEPEVTIDDNLELLKEY